MIEISPYTRGILEPCHHRNHLPGTIPTYVGNTPCRTVWALLHQNHPRIHGEYASTYSPFATPTEPSPHMWGILRETAIGNPPRGTIPTCVGNTRRLDSLRQCMQDHPHIYGKYLISLSQRSHKIGTIPAYMGNTLSFCVRSIILRNHPHMRGEYPRRTAS